MIEPSPMHPVLSQLVRDHLGANAIDDKFEPLLRAISDKWAELDQGKFAIVEALGKASRSDADGDNDAELLSEMREQLIVQDRMASVGMLAAGVAHEINNPLTYVMTNMEVLSHAIRELSRLDPDLREALDETNAGIERVCEIVRDLKTFSRFDATELGPVNVHAVIDSTLSMVANEIRHRAILEKDFSKVSNALGNSSRLGQVFLNLLVNAAQAVPAGHSTENTITIATREDRDSVIVEVRDTGRGMSADVVDKIFDPFFTTKPVGEGTGLGLSICHAIVTNLGGSLVCESEEGTGTSFRVILKKADGSVPPVGPAATPSRVRAGRVLVIDDEPYVTKAVSRALRHCDVTVATSGREALVKLLNDNDFDVIICDLMMPELTGMDVFEQVGRARPELQQRFVFMTGGTFTERARRFLHEVVNTQLMKPFDVHALRSAISEHLRDRR